jgi:hypothetical protein
VPCDQSSILGISHEAKARLRAARAVSSRK